MKVFKKIIKWFYPGIKVKRWIFLGILGIGIIIFGTSRVINDKFLGFKILDSIIISVGALLVISGMRSMVQSFLSIFVPYFEEDLVDILYRKRYLERGPRIVAIGGGHGLATLLMGLKEYTTNLIAVVTVADSGGSTGRLRESFNVPAPGDIRNCIVALADAPSFMGDLFQFRFKKESELKGHNFGNIFITALTQLTGDFKKAVEASSKVLAIRGKVLPSTLNSVSLCAEFSDGTCIEGEAKIPREQRSIKRVYLKSLSSGSDEKIQATPEVIESIRSAQIIVIGPGSLYTSILPNLVIEEITDAIIKSSAVKIYVCNVMTQHGETDNYDVLGHFRALIQNTHPKIADYCVVNTRIPNEEILARYRQEKAFPIEADFTGIRNMGYKIIKGNFIHDTDFVRHDSKKLARAIINAFRREEIRRRF